MYDETINDKTQDATVKTRYLTDDELIYKSFDLLIQYLRMRSPYGLVDSVTVERWVRNNWKSFVCYTDTLNNYLRLMYNHRETKATYHIHQMVKRGLVHDADDILELWAEQMSRIESREVV